MPRPRVLWEGALVGLPEGLHCRTLPWGHSLVPDSSFWPPLDLCVAPGFPRPDRTD